MILQHPGRRGIFNTPWALSVFVNVLEKNEIF